MELDTVGGVRSRGNMAIEQVGAIKIERGQASRAEPVEVYCPRWNRKSCAVFSRRLSIPSVILFKIRDHAAACEFRTIDNVINCFIHAGWISAPSGLGISGVNKARRYRLKLANDAKRSLFEHVSKTCTFKPVCWSNTENQSATEISLIAATALTHSHSRYLGRRRRICEAEAPAEPNRVSKWRGR